MKKLGNLHLKDNGENITIKTDNFAEYHDGFSFTVSEELEAFQAAYLYQHNKRVNVKKAAPGHGWSVQVYREAVTKKVEMENREC